MKKKLFVAVTNDISTDYRVHKVCSYLLQKDYQIEVYGRILPNTLFVKRDYNIIRKRHFFNHNFLFYAEFNIRLFCHLLFKKYDCIMANDLDTLPACFFISKLKKTALVYDSHELFSEVPELQGRKFVQKFWRKLEDFFLPRIEKSYTISQSIADFYNKKYQNNMRVIRNIPLKNEAYTFEDISFPTNHKTILYQGVLNPGRGIKPMIEALKFLDNVDLIIIGYGKVEADLKQFVKDNKMQHRVFFLGRISREKLMNYTQKATLGMVLEEPFGLSFQYALPNKLFDYIHAQLPIIAGNLKEISNIIKEYEVGIIVENYAPKTIATAIQNLLNDEKKMLQIKQNQQKVASVLCWENEQQKLDFFYN